MMKLVMTKAVSTTTRPTIAYVSKFLALATLEESPEDVVYIKPAEIITITATTPAMK